jgi:hypothetical protein
LVIDTPVYHPFATTIRALDRRVVSTPLVAGPGQGGGATARFGLDLRAIERAYAAGAARTSLPPHNPLGVYTAAGELEGARELADGFDVTMPERRDSRAAVARGSSARPATHGLDRRRAPIDRPHLRVESVEPGGLKAAAVVAGSAETRSIVARLPA